MNQRNKTIIYSLGLILFISLGTFKPIENIISKIIIPLSLGGSDQTLDNQDSVAGLVTDAKVQKLVNENQQLLTALELSANSKNQLVTARITARSAEVSRKKLKINKGANHKIDTGQVALADGIVIGKIEKASARSATILLIEDQAFRMEVIFGSDRGVLKGAINGAIIDRVLPDIKAEKNRLVTTVATDRIPPGLPVGRVVGKLDTNQNVFQQIQFAGYPNFGQTTYLQVVIK